MKWIGLACVIFGLGAFCYSATIPRYHDYSGAEWGFANPFFYVFTPFGLLLMWIGSGSAKKVIERGLEPVPLPVRPAAAPKKPQDRPVIQRPTPEPDEALEDFIRRQGE